MNSFFSKHGVSALCLSVIASLSLQTFAKDDVINANRKIQSFEISQVKLLPSPFKEAQDKNSQYLLSVEPDRLLSKLRLNAGLEPRAKNYGGWEDASIAGHSLGHYLSAVSKDYAATGNELFKERALYIVSELAECQNAIDSGMLAGDSRYAEVFSEIKRGEIRSQGFDLNGLWVPWYTLHKIFAGLIDAYHYCDCDQALEVARRLGDWGIEIADSLSFEQMQKMLACEYGGMNDAYYSLYAATGEKKYLNAGDRFYDLFVLKPLSEGRDELHGRHANTQIPKIIGLARRYEIAGSGEINAYATADFFWKRVTGWHSYAIGGNSSGEHFGEPGVISTRFSDTTCETCNTYNMLKLTQKLYMQTGEVEYVNYFERALYNHILASIDKSKDPEKLYTYFVPLTRGGFRTYSNRETTWTCCHGTGMENHTQYNGEIYYYETKEDGSKVLYVNLLIPSVLNWESQGLVVTINETGACSIDAQNDLSLDVRVRVPNNCYVARENGNLKDGYYQLGTQWSKGKTIKNLPFYAEWKIEPTPDDPDVRSFFCGPILYAGTIGPMESSIVTQLEIEAGNAPSNAVVVPVIVANDQNVENLVNDSITSKLSFFNLPNQAILTHSQPHDVTLVPFYVAKERYSAYFDFFTEETWAEEERQFLAERARQVKIAKETLTFFQPGEMQPERDCNFNSEKSVNGEYMGRKWRDARDGGFFEFDMKVDPNNTCSLIIDYWGDDVGNRNFDVIVDGQIIAEQKLDRNKPGQFFNELYRIPNPEKKSVVRVRFQAKPGAIAGGIFGARTMREDIANELFKK